MARALLPRLAFSAFVLLILIVCPNLVESNDILISWGTSAVPDQWKNVLTVPTRVLTSAKPIKYAKLSSNLNLLFDDNSIRSWGDSSNPFTDIDLLPVIDNFGTASLEHGTSRIRSMLPSNLIAVETANNLGLALDSNGLLWWWGDPNFWDQSMVQPSLNPSIFPSNALSGGYDSGYRSIKCQEMACVLHGNSGRLYLASIPTQLDLKKKDVQSIPTSTSWTFFDEIPTNTQLYDNNPARTFATFDLSYNNDVRLLARNASGFWLYFGNFGSNTYDSWTMVDDSYPGAGSLVASTFQTSLIIAGMNSDSPSVRHIVFEENPTYDEAVLEFLNRQYVANDPVVDVAGSATTFLFLTKNGSLFTLPIYEDANSWGEALTLTGSTVPSSVGFVEPVWMDTVVPAVPSTHVVSSIVGVSSTGQAFYVVAKPRTSDAASVDVPLFDSVTVPADPLHATIVNWGIPNGLSGVGWASGGGSSPARIPPMEVSLLHLDPSLRNFSKVVTSYDVAVALTSNGKVLTWGCNTFLNVGGNAAAACAGISPNSPVIDPLVPYAGAYDPFVPIPLPVDAAFYQNATVIDIAVSGDDQASYTALLLSDGSLAWWGDVAASTLMRRRQQQSQSNNVDNANKKSKKENKVQIADGSKFDSANIQFFPHPTTGKRFTSVGGSGGLLWAQDSDSSVWTWSNYAPNTFSEPAIVFNASVFGHIDFFDGYFGIMAAQVTNDTQTNIFMTSVVTLGYPADYQPQYASEGTYLRVPSPTIFNLSQTRQLLLSTSNSILILTDDNIYSIGSGPLAVPNNLAQKKDVRAKRLNEWATMPFSIDGLTDYSTIKKMAVAWDGLMVLTNDGRVFATQGGTQPDISHSNFRYLDLSDSSVPMVALTAPDFFFVDIVSDTSGNYDAYRLALGRPIANGNSPSTSTGNSDAEYETIAIGSDSTCAYGDGVCRSRPVGAHKFADDHPINSATAAIGINLVASVVDGNINATLPRSIRWGGNSLASDPAGVRYLRPAYMELPLSYNQTQVALEQSSLVKVVPVGLSHVSIYSNCKIDVQFYTNFGPTGGSNMPARRSMRKKSNSAVAGVLVPPVDWPVDPTYTFAVDPVYYVTDHLDLFWEDHNTDCMDDVQNSNLVVSDLDCAVATTDYSASPNPMDFHCLVRLSDSTLYSFGFFYTQGVQCYWGLFGNPAQCELDNQADATVATFHRIDDFSSDSALSGKKVTQFQLGVQHVVALTEDGTVLAWGSNDWSQLGLGQTAYVVPVDANSQADRIVNMKREVGYLSGTPTRVAVPNFETKWRKVIASSYASFALSEDSIIVGWGSNYNGELGRSIKSSDLQQSYEVERVEVPLGVIQDAACAYSTCYALYERGEIYSWGATNRGLLGRATSTSTMYGDPNPALATDIKLTDSAKVIEKLMTSPTAVTLAVRGRKKPVKPAAGPCVGNPPVAGFQCSEGKWVYVGDVRVDRSIGPGTPSMVISNPTVVIGNVSLPSGTFLQIQITGDMLDNPNVPILNVTGCFESAPDVRYTLSDETWQSKRSTMNGRQIIAIESSCQLASTTTTIQQAVETPNDCRKASAQAKGTDRPFNRFGLQSTFTVDSSRCSKWWMILLAVLAAVAVVVLVGVIAWRIYDKKRKMDPRRKSMIK